MSNYNKIYDEEVYKLVNNENRELLEDYTLELKSRNLSTKTIEQYCFDIRMMYCFIYENIQKLLLS